MACGGLGRKRGLLSYRGVAGPAKKHSSPSATIWGITGQISPNDI
jgi:hypothetical protein